MRAFRVFFVLLLMAPGIRAETFFSGGTGGGGFADAINNPADKWTWDLNPNQPITYKFDNTFLAAFPNNAVRDQIRFAFQTWDSAASTPFGSIDSYQRNFVGGDPSFGDIRTIALHEIGHVLGLGHPNQGAANSRNYRPTPAPSGPLTVAASTNREVMYAYTQTGEYNHVLSWDELDAFNRSYGGQDVSFQEVAANAPANITITTYTNAATNWANGPPSGSFRDSSNHLNGVRITSGMIQWNTSSGTPMGLKAHAQNWDYTPAAGQQVSSMVVRTRGTNNPTPLWHFDGYGAPAFFNTFTPVSLGDPNFKEDVVNTWGNPAGPIVGPNLVHIGLQPDVYDWTVVSAVAVAPGGAQTPAPLVTVHEWYNSIVQGTPSLPADLERLPSRITATAMRFTLTEQLPGAALIGNIAFADVTGRQFSPDDLNRRGMAELRKQGVQFQGFEFPSRLEMLAPGEDLFAFLTADDIPPDIADKGNFIVLDRPDLLGHELFVSFDSMLSDVTIGNFALITVVPAPDMRGALLFGFVGALLLRLPQRRRGERASAR
jgi:hypothetical protein